MRIRATILLVGLFIGLLGASTQARAGGTFGSDDSRRYGDLTFPADEHAHVDGLDYWWGAAEIATTSGNRYTVSLAYTSFFGDVVPGHQVTPHQGAYEGQMLLTEWGPAEWGHPESTPGSIVSTATVFVPGVSERLRLQTLDTDGGGEVVDSFERATLDDFRYRFLIDQQQAEVHPAGDRIRLHVDLDIDMRDGPPLLPGGRGTWLYGTPEYFGDYPSRSFQYSQAAQTIDGTIAIEQPDGTIVTEQVDPTRSSMVFTHEYDATPEDIPGGLALTAATQLHHRFVQEYQGGIPWELMYFDIGNGAQLQLLVQAYHDTEDGTVGNARGTFSVPTYRVMGTIRLPSGESVALDDQLHVEHLEYREIIGRVPTTFVAVTGHWIQTWKLRVGFPGATAEAGDGTIVEVPPFDLGIEPFADKTHTFVDDNGDGLTQRVALRVAGIWNQCPVEGTGWSEIIVNWSGRTERDPWFTGRGLPDVPEHCDDGAEVETTDGNGRSLSPEGENPPLPDPTTSPEGCSAGLGTTACTFVATHDGSIDGYAAEPGGWTVTIEREGRPDPIVVRGFTGTARYGCGIIRPGDHVTAEADSGSYVNSGNPLVCN